MAPIGKLEGAAAAAAAASSRCASIVVERYGVSTLSFVSRPSSAGSSFDVENDLGRSARLFASRDDEARASVADRTPFTRVAVIARR